MMCSRSSRRLISDTRRPTPRALRLKCRHFSSLRSPFRASCTARIKHKMKHSRQMSFTAISTMCNKSMIEPFGIERNKFVFLFFPFISLLISYTTAERAILSRFVFLLLLLFFFSSFSAISNYVSFGPWRRIAERGNFQGKHKNNEESIIFHFSSVFTFN